jgi:hypothetical protein
MIFAKNFARNYEKKIILGTSDAWLMSHLSQGPRKPVYYIEDFRICAVIDVQAQCLQNLFLEIQVVNVFTYLYVISL